jgi:hypothetical protein
VLGETQYNQIDVGDLVSWTDLNKDKRKRRGIVLKKFESKDFTLLVERKVAMLKVADLYDNQIVNILAINAKIESKSTT